MAEIRLHPDGFAVGRFTDNFGEPRWLGIHKPDDGLVTAYTFTDEEAADWPRLEVVDD